MIVFHAPEIKTVKYRDLDVGCAEKVRRLVISPVPVIGMHMVVYIPLCIFMCTYPRQIVHKIYYT